MFSAMKIFTTGRL